MRGLHWFRADLRISDNTALIKAIAETDSLFAIFIITTTTWQRHDAAAVKVQFILENLQILSASLWELGIPLLIRNTNTFADCNKVLSTVCKQHKIDAIYFNKQYEWDEQQRDNSVISEFSKDYVVHACDDQLMLPPGSVLSKQNKPFQVFTPFKNAWLQQLEKQQAWYPTTRSNKKFQSLSQPEPIPKSIKEFSNTIDISQWPSGEAQANKKLQQFSCEQLSRYHLDRDFPAINGTSQLSPYLAQGLISPRQCMEAVLNACDVGQPLELKRYEGAYVWITELIWREFYKHIIYFYPQVCKGKPFRAKTDDLPWSYDESMFEAWCQGKTGYPLVDAAMRQLNQTGWMHNRLRMVVAMFLSKTLFLDWRLGEKYFMQNLIDGDFAANNGGWQWSASTGTDSVPYFRIFNPVTQSERFDSEGSFIRKFCPELSQLDNKTIHDPYARGVTKGELNYPLPIVDYKFMRNKVIDAFKRNS